MIHPSVATKAYNRYMNILPDPVWCGLANRLFYLFHTQYLFFIKLLGVVHMFNINYCIIWVGIEPVLFCAPVTKINTLVHSDIFR